MARAVLSLLLLLALGAAPLARAQEAANPSVRVCARSGGGAGTLHGSAAAACGAAAWQADARAPRSAAARRAAGATREGSAQQGAR
jgi:hypothetical protein